MLRRTLTVIITIAIITALLRFDTPHYWFCTLFVALLTAWATWEFSNLFLIPAGLGWPKLLLVVNAGLILICPFTGRRLESFMACLLVGMLGLCVASLVRAKSDLRTYLDGLARTLFGYFYIAFPMATIVLMLAHFLGERYTGRALVVFLLTATLLCDAGAYLTGRMFGHLGPKFAPVISPKKTVIGALGGLVFAVLGVLIVGAIGDALVHARGDTWFYWMKGTAQDWFIAGALALAIGIFGQVGDLVESALKRSVGVKDSGSDITGHGGALDMIDALLFTAPVFYVYALFCI